MKLYELLAYGNQVLTDASIADAALDARYLLEWVLHISQSYILVNRTEEVSEEKEDAYMEVIKRRSEHVPLQYITNEQSFMGYNFYVNENVLIPRQDTEVLVEAVYKHIMRKPDKYWNIIDMCCGSGCIGISINKLLQTKGVDNTITAVDISEEALKVTKRNANQLQSDIRMIESDLFTEVNGRYQIIVSNPPYIPSKVVDTLMPEVLEHEPRLALDGDIDGLRFYRRIVEEAVYYLEDEGYVFFEIGFDQAEDLREILVDAGFENVVVIQDLSGLDRVVLAKLKAGLAR